MFGVKQAISLGCSDMQVSETWLSRVYGFSSSIFGAKKVVEERWFGFGLCMHAFVNTSTVNYVEPWKIMKNKYFQERKKYQKTVLYPWRHGHPCWTSGTSAMVILQSGHTHPLGARAKLLQSSFKRTLLSLDGMAISDTPTIPVCQNPLTPTPVHESFLKPLDNITEKPKIRESTEWDICLLSI